MKPYIPTYLPDGRKAYNPSRTITDIHQEWETFRQRLIAEGESNELVLHMKSREMWRQEEQDAEPWREWQQRVWYPRMEALAATTPSKELTPEEWAFLADHFDGANDPIAQAILLKALRHADTVQN